MGIVNLGRNGKGIDLYEVLLPFVYTQFVIETLLQLLGIYLFAAVPWFVGWIANGGKREDVAIPFIGSVLLTCLLIPLFYFFA
jgi:hypothetical protein